MLSIYLSFIDDFFEVKKLSRAVRFAKCSSLSFFWQGYRLYHASVFLMIPYEFSGEKLPSPTSPQLVAVLERFVSYSSKH